MAKNNNERFKYGICLNEDCSKCKSKEVQQVSMRKEFVCSECGQELRECAPPKKLNPMPIIYTSIAIILIALVVVGIMLVSKSKKQKAEAARIAAIEQARQDSIAAAEAALYAEEQARLAAEEAARLAAEEEATRIAAEEESKKHNTQTPPSTGSIDYGKWSGTWKSGKPHGTGTMRYTKDHLIDSRDPQKRVAKAGDYIIGEFANGKLVQGTWYDAANNVKGSVIIGM